MVATYIYSFRMNFKDTLNRSAALSADLKSILGITILCSKSSPRSSVNAQYQVYQVTSHLEMLALCFSHILRGLMENFRKKWQESNDRRSSLIADNDNDRELSLLFIVSLTYVCMFLVQSNFVIIRSELYVFLWKRCESDCLLNYSPFQHGRFFVTMTTAHSVNKNRP